jgi:hypothetical protein
MARMERASENVGKVGEIERRRSAKDTSKKDTAPLADSVLIFDGSFRLRHRRERTTTIRKYNDLQEAGGHLSPC